MKTTILYYVLTAACLAALPVAAGDTATKPEPAACSTPLGQLSPDSASQGWGELHTDASVQGKPLSVGGRKFAHGLGTHAVSEIVYELDGKYNGFSALVGVDDEMQGYTASSVVFQVFADGKKLFDSGVMRLNDPAKAVNVSLAGVDELKLVVTDAGDGIHCDHADWCDPLLLGGRPVETAAAVEKYRVVAPGITIGLDDRGHIVGSSVAALSGRTRLGGCKQTSDVVVKQLAGGGYAFQRTLCDAQGHRATAVDTFTPSKDSIRWEVEIAGDGPPWTTEVVTQLKYPATAVTRFWTAWSDPEHGGGPWRDPLVLRPLANLAWTVGGRMDRGDFTAAPLATLVEPAQDRGLSLVFSPEDTILNERLTTSPTGQIRYARSNHRLGGGKPLCFALDLTAHEADWRGGLRWMVKRYPASFDPPNPLADQMAGCGAYSGDEDPIDVAKFKKMAFRINWEMSDDFPYMGMFIPPVKDADEKWDRSCDEPAPANKPRWTSCRKMNDYARYMKSNGFYVLNYFNVTEFGKHMGGPAAKKPGDPLLWKDPRAFLTTQLPGAVLVVGNATCYQASAVDPGDPAFQKFILEQAEQHIRLIPDSFGICIDRLDWLERNNGRVDDGVSWIGGKPARSLFVSWNGLLSRLGPQMHEANKVIFVNPLHSRLDLLRQVDGIYTEFGNVGTSLNACALMGVRKPVLAWTYNATLRQPGPDAFMQRHLHLGAYPTAPYPWNNHCITPEPSADRLYLDYGPLLDALRGKKWVLQPHCVECGTPGIKVNLFEVPGGYAAPVTFGGKADWAEVSLRNLPGLDTLKVSALHPGKASPVSVDGLCKNGMLKLRVPLVRGCAMVIVKK